jgi:serine/threonine-protein kinase
VQFAHERGVLHRDLKPSNLLIDSAGEPFVSDFGLARLLSGENSETHGKVAGSLGFMAYEQALGAAPGLTVAADVYALGAILYDVLTGVPPRQAEDLTQLIEQFEARPAVAPHKLNPKVPRELSDVCMCALERDPQLRYRSAAAFADDLKRVLAGKPSQRRNAEAPTGLVEAAYWLRRHSALVGLAVTIVMGLSFVPFLPVSADITRQIRDQNKAVASVQAVAVMNELRNLARHAAAMSRSHRVMGLTNWQDIYTPAPVLKAELGPFDLGCVFTADGDLRARYPAASARYTHFNYSYRDYFTGQYYIKQNAELAYVSRVFLSTGDTKLHFGLSAPIFDAAGEYAGAVLAAIATSSTFGAVRMTPGNCNTALLAARDHESDNEPLPTRLTVIAATGLGQGTDKTLDAHWSEQLCKQLRCEPALFDQFNVDSQRASREPLAIDNFPDPMTGKSSIAAFAPVADTGIIVMVATPNTYIKHWTPFLLVPLVVTAFCSGMPRLLKRRRRECTRES